MLRRELARQAASRLQLQYAPQRLQLLEVSGCFHGLAAWLSGRQVAGTTSSGLSNAADSLVVGCKQIFLLKLCVQHSRTAAADEEKWKSMGYRGWGPSVAR